ncbi:MAG: hypothetical protein HKP24_12240 [Croceitalea sp.]|nr:hypothetical protein [Croceitalea sp.]
MKAIFTLLIVIFFGTLALAQDSVMEIKVSTLTMPISMKVDVKATQTSKKEVKVARLYMFKNSRVKKELAFSTKRNKSKLA